MPAGAEQRRRLSDARRAHVRGHHGWPLVTHPATTLRHVAVPTPSDVVDAHVGTPSVAEAAALLSAAGGPLLVPKRRSARATCALAEAP